MRTEFTEPGRVAAGASGWTESTTPVSAGVACALGISSAAAAHPVMRAAVILVVRMVLLSDALRLCAAQCYSSRELYWTLVRVTTGVESARSVKRGHRRR
ncbi:hypothetical protein FMUAM8_52610 [Nocardia cyriacigeorgica]|nr:hypothetical protein FMUAM8_52610 [Nocardia cyriacigeorgica]BDU08888.1 hypothetical protein FMUBM48_51510 [Nocardia cyriacigeorgica]